MVESPAPLLMERIQLFTRIAFYMKTKLLNLYLTAQIAVVFAMGVHIASNHRPVPVELELTATLNCVNSDCVDTQAGLTERLPHLTDGRWYQYAITRYP